MLSKRKYFDQHAKQLSELNPGDIVRMKLPGETQWSQAVVSSKIAPRSYRVEANGKVYRRNRKQLRQTKEELQESSLDIDEGESMSAHNVPDLTKSFPVTSPDAEVKKAEITTRPSPSAVSRKLEQSARTPETSVTTPQLPLVKETRSRYGRLIRPPKKFDPDSYG